MPTLPTTMIRTFGPVRATFLQESLPTRSSARGWRHPRSWTQNRQLCPACDGLGPTRTVLSLPSGPQLCQLVESGGESHSPGVGGGSVRARRRSSGRWHRRDPESAYGKKIAARGVYRDPVRSTHENFVKMSGLRWVCVMLLVEVPWASRAWALPFLSALVPSERYAAKRGKRHKKMTEWAWQLLLLLGRWYPQREIVAVADRAYASLKLLSRCRSLRVGC